MVPSLPIIVKLIVDNLQSWIMIERAALRVKLLLERAHPDGAGE